MSTDRHEETRRSWAWVPATVVAGVVATVLAWFITSGIEAHLSGTPDTAPPTSSPSSSPGGSAPSPTQEPIAPPAFTPVSLTLDSAVAYEQCKGDGRTGYSWEGEIGPLVGEVYASGFSCPMGYTSASGYRDYLIPAGATRFTAIAGQPDDSQNTTLVVRFEVLDTTSGATLASHDLPFGQPQAIDLSVDGLTRITLRQRVVSSTTSPRDVWGIAGWADPTFR